LASVVRRCADVAGVAAVVDPVPFCPYAVTDVRPGPLREEPLRFVAARLAREGPQLPFDFDAFGIGQGMVFVLMRVVRTSEYVDVLRIDFNDRVVIVRV